MSDETKSLGMKQETVVAVAMISDCLNALHEVLATAHLALEQLPSLVEYRAEEVKPQWEVKFHDERRGVLIHSQSMPDLPEVGATVEIHGDPYIVGYVHDFPHRMGAKVRVRRTAKPEELS